MRHQFRYLLGALGAAASLLSFAVCLQIQAATAHTGVEPMILDRTLKGDRVRPSSGASEPTARPKILDGCELSFSGIRKPQASDVAGRCIALVPSQSSLA